MSAIKDKLARAWAADLQERVCAIPFSDLDRRLPRVLARGPRWWEKLGYLWRVWQRRAGKEYLDFQGYLMDHGCPPATFADDGGGGEGESDSALPGVLGLVTGLMRGTGWEPATVWACHAARRSGIWPGCSCTGAWTWDSRTRVTRRWKRCSCGGKH
jgi:hypothetical protein